LFYQKGLVEYYYKGQIQRSGSRVYFKKVMSTNCKISFANIRHKYDLKNDIPTIIFDAVKLIYQPDTEEKYLISISVEMVNNNSEPMITNITINDMEKCF
jgi:hypothetical protein